MGLIRVGQQYIFKSPVLYDNLGVEVDNSATVQILIRKESGDNDGFFWTGSGWVAAETWIDVSPISFRATYNYPATLTSDGFIGIWWRDNTYPLFGGSEQHELVGTRLEEEIVGVDDDYVGYVSRLRRYLRDLVNLNHLWEAREASDTELQELLEDSLEEINLSQEPLTAFTIINVPWFLVRDGALLQFFKSMGIHSARNFLTYSDPSGIQLKDHDEYGRYLNFYNVLINKYRENLINVKRRINMAACYKDVASEWYEAYD